MRASDRGEPPSYADVDVELDVVDRNNKPPLWDMNMYGPIHIKENVTVGTVVTSVKARLVSEMRQRRGRGVLDLVHTGWEGELAMGSKVPDVALTTDLPRTLHPSASLPA